MGNEQIVWKIELDTAVGSITMATHNDPMYDCPPSDDEEEEIDGRVAFPSTFGGRPVNAISNHPYPFRLGDPKQQQLFEVRSTAGELDMLGVPVKPGDQAPRDPIRLFYDNPKQYLVHRAALLGMGTSDDDIEHMMRHGFGAQPPMDLVAWADMTRRWRSRQSV